MALPARLTFALLTPLLLAPIALRAQVEDWTVYAGVVDRTGTPVLGLSAADFVVRENGVAREILRVSPATDSLRIAVLIDNSQEMRNDLIDIRQGLRGFVNEIDRRHEVSLTGFGGPPTVLVDYTSDLKRLETGVARLLARPGTGSYLLSAIIDTSRALRKRRDLRRVMVIVTTQGPEFSEISYQTVLEYVRESGAPMHSYVLQARGRLADRSGCAGSGADAGCWDADDRRPPRRAPLGHGDDAQAAVARCRAEQPVSGRLRPSEDADSAQDDRSRRAKARRRRPGAARVLRCPPRRSGQALRDRIAPGVRVLFVGINPGIRSAQTGHHFAGYSNRFWKLLFESKLVPEPSTGGGRQAAGMGIRHHQPCRARNARHRHAEPRGMHSRHRACCARKCAGSSPKSSRLSACRCIGGSSAPKAPSRLGPQRVTFEGAQVFVLPNPSGRNANFSYAEMLAAFRKLRRRLDRGLPDQDRSRSLEPCGAQMMRSMMLMIVPMLLSANLGMGAELTEGRSMRASWTRTTRRSPESRQRVHRARRRRGPRGAARLDGDRADANCRAGRYQPGDGRAHARCAHRAARVLQADGRQARDRAHRPRASAPRCCLTTRATPRDSRRRSDPCSPDRAAAPTFSTRIVETSDGLRRRKAARPHIIVYAARGPEFSERYHQSVIDALRESGATLHTLMLNRPGAAMGSREEQELAKAVAERNKRHGRPPRRPAYADGAERSPAVARERARESVPDCVCAAVEAGSAERHGGCGETAVGYSPRAADGQ